MASETKSRRQRSSKAVVHQCSKEELLDRISLVLFGNGHPEDGLAFLVRAFIKDHRDMQSDIKEIKGKVDNAIESAGKANNAVEKYKKEMEDIEKGKKEIGEEIVKTTHEKREKFRSVLQTILAIIAAGGLCFTAYFGFKNGKTAERTENRVENLGSPVVTNPRGETVNLPEGYSLKMFPGDFDDDTTLKN